MRSIHTKEYDVTEKNKLLPHLIPCMNLTDLNMSERRRKRLPTVMPPRSVRGEVSIAVTYGGRVDEEGPTGGGAGSVPLHDLLAVGGLHR